METRFDMDNFEQTLKEHADQFSMIPSKRVWNGVYNSLHPGSAWPSLTMLLFFLLTLVGIGPLNQSSKNYTVTTLPDNTENSVTDENEATIFSMNTYLKADNSYLISDNSLSEGSTTGKLISLNNNSDQNPGVQNSNIGSQISNDTDGDGLYLKKALPDNKTAQNSLPESAANVLQEDKFEMSTPKAPIVNIHTYKEKNIASTVAERGVVMDEVVVKEPSIILNENIIIDDSRSLESFLKSNVGNPIFLQIEEIDRADTDIESPTQATTQASVVKKPAKRNSKTTWIFFATPAITTTYFTGKPLEGQNPLVNSSPLIVNPNQIGNTMRYNARVGLSIGTEVNYKFSENWEVVTGTQLSYSGYNILSHKVHPTFSYLYLKNEENAIEPKKYITFYGSGEGLDEAVLHNKSIQLSIPVGIKYSVWKNNNVEIKIGTSLQPSLVVKADAYILSADGRNYVNDPDLMRNVNISGEFNSSISFQGDKVKWHVGPTVRYQALSSYKNIYPVNEHLIDYGIRIGISK